MSYQVTLTERFGKKLKKLHKKYASIYNDLMPIIDELSTNPNLGVKITDNCFKIRVAIKSKSKGKSAGARIITYVQTSENEVTLIDIYDKSDEENIPESRLKELIEELKP